MSELPVDPNVDPYGYLGLTRNPDGSFTRLPYPTPNAPSNPIIFSQDFVINSTKNTLARLIIPCKIRDSNNKYPLIIYFHGGGFVMTSPVDATPETESVAATVVDEIPAIALLVDYRNAPEHRLPAAYDDCMESLDWIKNTPDDHLLKKYADLSKCFIMGTSAGGNIAYYVGLRVAEKSEDFKPLEFKGLIIHHAFFGGTERKPSELKLAEDRIVPYSVTDIMWELALPTGSDREHPYCNPMVEIKSKEDFFDQVKKQNMKILMNGCDGDPLIDRQIELSKVMKEKGVQVVESFTEGGCHGVELFDPNKCKELASLVKEFVSG